MAKYRLPRRNWPAKTRPIKIADRIYEVAGLFLIATLFSYDWQLVEVSLGLAGLILFACVVVALVAEGVSNHFRTRVGLPTLDDEIMLYEAA